MQRFPLSDVAWGDPLDLDAGRLMSSYWLHGPSGLIYFFYAVLAFYKDTVYAESASSICVNQLNVASHNFSF